MLAIAKHHGRPTSRTGTSNALRASAAQAVLLLSDLSGGVTDRPSTVTRGLCEQRVRDAVPRPRDAWATGMGSARPGRLTSRAEGEGRSAPPRGPAMSQPTGSTTAPYAAPARRSVSCCRRCRPWRSLRSYAATSIYGLISLAEACKDAGLDHREDELRGGDAPVPAWTATTTATAPGTTPIRRRQPAMLKSLFVRLRGRHVERCRLVHGVARIHRGQLQLRLRLLLGAARHRPRTTIASGRSDLVVVTGVDRFDTKWVLHGHRLRRWSSARA
ncbi:hypothetical protein SMICM17S_12715 [Streptomyces microflavus]